LRTWAEGNPRQPSEGRLYFCDREGDHFPKIQADPCFLDCGGLTPLWIFPSTRSLPIQSSVKPEHSRTPSWPQNILGNCGTWAIPNLFALSRLRVRPLPLLPPGACSKTSLAFAESSGARSSHQVGVWLSIPINGGQPPQWSICDRATMAPTSSLPQNDSISAVVL
jgi:hypothetical protein